MHSPSPNQRQNPSPNPNQKCMRSLHHGQGTQARGPIKTQAPPLALHPLALVVVSLCCQAWLPVVNSARVGPMQHVPPIPPLANAAFARLPMHLGRVFSSYVCCARVCMPQHILDIYGTIHCPVPLFLTAFPLQTLKSPEMAVFVHCRRPRARDPP